MTVTADFLLSHREYAVLWSDLDCGPAPYPLAVAGHGATDSERGEIRAEVYRELGRRGLLGSQLDPDLAGLLRLLTRPRFLVDSAGFTDRPIRAVAARRGQAAVLAEMSEQGLALAAIRPTALVGGLVGLLPEAERGRGRAMTVRYSDLRQAVTENEDGDDPLGMYDEHDALLQAGVPGEDAAWLLRMAENRTCGGQFGVNVSENGATHRLPMSVTWFDSEGGRYMMVRDGDWLSIAPADSGKIVHSLDRVLTEHVR